MVRGRGHAGFCKICAHPEAPRFVKGARDGWNAKQAQTVGEMVGLTFNRQTWYTHLEHAKTGEQMVIQAAEQVRKSGALTVAGIRKNSNTDVLGAIRDLGMKRALEHPEDVGIDHALKAVQILEARKDRGSDQLNILVQFVTGNAPTVVVERPTEVIEGTAVEITPDGEPDSES